MSDVQSDVPSPQKPAPRAPPHQGRTCGGLRVAAPLCASAMRRRFCLLAQPGLQCSPSQRPTWGGGKGGRGQMSQQSPHPWGGQMGCGGGRDGGAEAALRGASPQSRPPAAALPADGAAVGRGPGCPCPQKGFAALLVVEQLTDFGFVLFLVQKLTLRWKAAPGGERPGRAGGCFSLSEAPRPSEAPSSAWHPKPRTAPILTNGPKRLR